MQTFLPYPDFTESAHCLDNKRLGKQRVEVLQILQTLEKGRTHTSRFGCIIKTPWYDHPAVQMWKGHEVWLVDYGWAICEEWIKRGFKDTCLDKILDTKFANQFLINPPLWLDLPEFHSSHRSNLLRKNPSWYKQFNWSEPDNLPYYWPTKQQVTKI